MHTQTHVIMGAALFGRAIPRRARIAALGGLLPDLPMLLMVLVLKLIGIPAPIIFGVLYWQEWWQVTNAIAHNVWLWGGLLVAALIWHERRNTTAQGMDRASLLAAFSASGLLHLAIDFLCHREDAHMSFWPVSRWKFISPVSYYDPAHYGQYVSLFEAAMGLTLAALVFSRFRNRWTRIALALAMLLYVAVPAYFMLN